MKGKNMKIYFSHSKDIDYENVLYRPLRQSNLNNKFELIFPYEKGPKPTSSKTLLKEKGIILVADISTPSTGLGIEIGWADSFGCRIICIYKKGSMYSRSISLLVKEFIEYESPSDLVAKLETILYE